MAPVSFMGAFFYFSLAFSQFFADIFLHSYSAADAFTIAAGPKPVAAFLDMVVMVTLGRMVFEQHYANIHGSEVAPIVDGFKKAEADIWQIAGDILTAEQQQKLMRLIQTWRQNNPKNIVFSSVRFSEFEKFRGFSDESGKKSSGGLFRSVAKATEQVEEMRSDIRTGHVFGIPPTDVDRRIRRCVDIPINAQSGCRRDFSRRESNR
jgi:hypothetical protein